MHATAVCVWVMVSSAAAAARQAAGAQPSNQVADAVRESFQQLIAALVRVLPAIATAAVVLLLFWGLPSLARRIAGVAAEYIRDRTAKMLVTQVTYYVVWAIGSWSRSTPSA